MHTVPWITIANRAVALLDSFEVAVANILLRLPSNIIQELFDGGGRPGFDQNHEVWHIGVNSNHNFKGLGLVYMHRARVHPRPESWTPSIPRRKLRTHAKSSSFFRINPIIMVAAWARAAGSVRSTRVVTKFNWHKPRHHK